MGVAKEGAQDGLFRGRSGSVRRKEAKLHPFRVWAGGLPDIEGGGRSVSQWQLWAAPKHLQACPKINLGLFAMGCG